MRTRLVLGAVLLILVCWALTTAGDMAVGKVVRIIDGDTFVVVYLSGGAGLSTHIRTYLASTPERSEPGGSEAEYYAWKILFGQIVWLEHQGSLTYGRLLAFVYLDAAKLSLFQAIMIAQGYAKVDIRHPEEERFREQMERLQVEAQALRLGRWATCDLPDTDEGGPLNGEE